MSVQIQEADKIFEEIRKKQEKQKKKDQIKAIVSGFISILIGLHEIKSL